LSFPSSAHKRFLLTCSPWPPSDSSTPIHTSTVFPDRGTSPPELLVNIKLPVNLSFFFPLFFFHVRYIPPGHNFSPTQQQPVGCSKLTFPSPPGQRFSTLDTAMRNPLFFSVHSIVRFCVGPFRLLSNLFMLNSAKPLKVPPMSDTFSNDVFLPSKVALAPHQYLSPFLTLFLTVSQFRFPLFV